jgi:prepilin-type N-terminal cleavage/methylation domain-containing protein
VTFRRQRWRWQSGVTLVEVLAALAVIAIGIVGVAVVVPVAILGVHEGYQASTATFLAEQAMERVRALPWSESPAIDCLGLSLGDSSPIPSSATCRGATSTQLPDEPTGVSGHPQYRRFVRVTSCVSEPCAEMRTTGLRRVEVTVAYRPLTAKGVSGRDTTLRLESLAAQR